MRPERAQQAVAGGMTEPAVDGPDPDDVEDRERHSSW